MPSTEPNAADIMQYVEGTLLWDESVVSVLNIDRLLQGVVVNQG
jgi:chemotaxis signal transduction protein